MSSLLVTHEFPTLGKVLVSALEVNIAAYLITKVEEASRIEKKSLSEISHKILLRNYRDLGPSRIPGYFTPAACDTGFFLHGHAFKMRDSSEAIEFFRRCKNFPVAATTPLSDLVATRNYFGTADYLSFLLSNGSFFSHVQVIRSMILNFPAQKLLYIHLSICIPQ